MTPLKASPDEKDLGVVIDEELKFHPYVLIDEELKFHLYVVIDEELKFHLYVSLWERNLTTNVQT